MAQKRHLAGQPLVGRPFRSEILDGLLPDSFRVASISGPHSSQCEPHSLAGIDERFRFSEEPPKQIGGEASHPSAGTQASQIPARLEQAARDAEAAGVVERWADGSHVRLTAKGRGATTD